jgi:CRISPR-associated endonuclease/helicase Cas3
VFVKNVYESIRDERLTEEKITNLMGLRSAYSVKKRMNDGNYNEEILKDFTDTPKFNKWKSFVDKVSEEYDMDYGIRVPSENFTQLLRVLYASLDCLNTLRGKSVNIEVKYPRGHKKVATEYSLLSVLIQYNCRLEDGAIVVDESGVSDSLIEVKGLKGNQNISTYNDLNSIVDSYEDMLDSAESELEDRMNLFPSLVKEYFKLIGSRNAVIIEKLKLGNESTTL